MGIDSLKNRAKAINAAELNIKSIPGLGTEIAIIVRITQMRDVNLLQSKLNYFRHQMNKIYGRHSIEE